MNVVAALSFEQLEDWAELDLYQMISILKETAVNAAKWD